MQNLQQLLKEISSIKPVLRITNDELVALFNLLRRNYNIKSPKTLTPKAQKTLNKAVKALQEKQSHPCAMSQPIFLEVLGERMQWYGVIFQWDTSKKDPLRIWFSWFLRRTMRDPGICFLFLPGTILKLSYNKNLQSYKYMCKKYREYIKEKVKKNPNQHHQQAPAFLGSTPRAFPWG